MVSCSATGKPAPSVSWDTAGIDSATETLGRRVENADTTVTVSSQLTLLLPTSADSVFCVVDGGSSGLRQEQIFFNSGGDKEVENGT